jgi:DUF917 family protein
MNTFFPLAVATRLGIPCLDADGMRRTLPEVGLTTFTLAGVPVSPMSVGDEKGNIVTVEIADNKLAADVARLATMRLGLSSACVSYPMTAATARSAAVRDSLSYCLRLGELLRAAQRGESLRPLLEYSGGTLLGQGRVIAVDRQVTLGFPRGSITLERLDDDAGTLRVEMQNELLLAIDDGVIVVTPPDLICMLDSDGLEPLITDDLVEGQRVRIVALPSAPEWWRPGVLDLVGPRAFGYEVNPRPLAPQNNLAEGRHGHGASPRPSAPQIDLAESGHGHEASPRPSAPQGAP